MVDSWNPPRPNVHHAIESSVDGGATWTPFVKDWKIVRREPEAKAFGTLTYVWGSGEVAAGPVRVRVRNDRGQEYFRAEAHLTYETKGRDATRVTFDWTDGAGPRRQSNVFPNSPKESEEWVIPTGQGVETRWVEYEPVAAK